MSLTAPHIITSPLERLLDGLVPFDDTEAAHVLQTRQLLADSKNPYDRSNLVAHVVADAWVVSPDRTQVLLHRQSAGNIWTTPG